MPDLSKEETLDIQFICETLASHKEIWAPDIARQVKEGKLDLDDETKQWLFYEVAKELPSRPNTPAIMTTLTVNTQVNDTPERKLSR